MRAAVPVAAPPLTIPLPILVAAFCLIWSAAFAVSKLAMLDCPPLILVSARCIFAGAVVLAALFLPGMRPRLTARDPGAHPAPPRRGRGRVRRRAAERAQGRWPAPRHRRRWRDRREPDDRRRGRRRR